MVQFELKEKVAGDGEIRKAFSGYEIIWLMDTDMIFSICFDGGKLEAQGTHAELLRKEKFWSTEKSLKRRLSRFTGISLRLSSRE